MTEQEINKVIERIKDTLNQAAENAKAKSCMNRGWTRECLHGLAKLGNECDCATCPEVSTMKGEWLYDMIWYKEIEDGTDDRDIWPKRMSDVVLVAESEWSNWIGDIRYDFQKLVQAKAQIKLLICEGVNDDEYASLVKDIESFEHRDPQERYLFAIYDGRDGVKKFDYKYYPDCEKGQ